MILRGTCPECGSGLFRLSSDRQLKRWQELPAIHQKQKAFHDEYYDLLDKIRNLQEKIDKCNGLAISFDVPTNAYMGAL